MESNLPACDAAQLGAVSAQLGQPDADGKVYGTFRITNVSGTECAVSGDGQVGFQALGAADPAKINVIDHSAGDAASGLPDPSQEPGAVVLKPVHGVRGEVRLGPQRHLPAPTPVPSPEPTPTDGGSAGTTSGTMRRRRTAQTQFVTEDGGPTDGSVAVTHTAEPGSPTTQTTIANACAGTIYRTGVLTAP